ESPLGLASALIGEHVGPMDIVLELRLADNTLLDRKPLRLEWVAAGPKQSTGSPIRQLDPREIADLIKRGEGFISAGDLASARLVLQRAAEAGDPQAALMRRGAGGCAGYVQTEVAAVCRELFREFCPSVSVAR